MLQIIKTIPFPADDWPGKWIWIESPGSALEVLQFVHSFSIDADLPTVRLHVSADNRYKLYLNGQFLGLGPQRGDLGQWYFETYDISAALTPGRHVLSAIVWHDRDTAPAAQISARPAFLIAAESPRISTSEKWRCRYLAI